jgi:hypothetical protein
LRVENAQFSFMIHSQKAQADAELYHQFCFCHLMLKKTPLVDVVVHTQHLVGRCSSTWTTFPAPNPSTQEAEAGGFQVPGQPELPGKTMPPPPLKKLPQTQTKKPKTKKKIPHHLVIHITL